MDDTEAALTLMNLPGELRLTEHGIWLHDGRTVAHQRISSYFSRHLRWSEVHQEFVIAVGTRCVSVVIDDRPFLVAEFDLRTSNLRQYLSSEEWETCQMGSFEVNQQDVWYCHSETKQCSVRVSRSALQSLLPLVVSDAEGFLLAHHGEKYRIKQTPAC